MHVTVTGFEPFGGLPSNPSETLVRTLPDRVPGLSEVRIRTAVLPVDSEGVRPALKSLWERAPLALIHLGVAESRSTLGLETRAHNRLDFARPDNAGVVRRNEAIEPDGPALVGTRLPVDVMCEWLDRRGVPARLSKDAGRYLCNQVMYLSLRALPRPVPTGFIHVPPDAELARALRAPPAMPDEVAAEAILDCVRWTAELAMSRRDEA